MISIVTVYNVVCNVISNCSVNVLSILMFNHDFTAAVELFLDKVNISS